MRPPLPEAIDKFSILSLKIERLPDDKDREMVIKEHSFYKAVIDSYRQDPLDVKDEWIAALIAINGRIWDVEASIRQGKDAELGLEEIGRRAIRIREINKERVEYKNKIAQEIGMDFFEVKVNHASA